MPVPDSPDGTAPDPAALLHRFRQAHPDGGPDRLRAWAAEQPELAGASELVERAAQLLAEEGVASTSLGGLLPGGHDSEDLALFGQRRTGAGWEALEAGRRLGRFVLEDFIARGGQGQIWRATDVELQRPVALKLLLPGLIDPWRLERFAREARAGGRCSHPNLVATYAFGEDEGLSWIAQELVEGSRTLQTRLELARREEPLPREYYRETAELVAKVADGLEAAHQAGVVHRDLKPANVMLTVHGVPKVTDFGLARVKDDPLRSETGQRGGTAYYMSPEQVQDRTDGMDHRTDIFSLGVVLYELLTLRRPFEGDTKPQVMLRILNEDPLPASRLRSHCPEELSVICGKAMEKRPQDRYQSAAELAADLRRHLANEPILAKPPGAVTRGVKWMRRHPAVSAAGAIASAALVVVSGLVVRLGASNERLQRARDEAEAVVSFQERQIRQVDPALLGRHWREHLRGAMTQVFEGQGLGPEVVEAVLADLDLTEIGRASLGDNFFAPALQVLDTSLGHAPLLQARIRESVAFTLAELGLGEQALVPQRQALEAHERLLGADDARSLKSMQLYASLLRSKGELSEARRWAGRALDGQAHSLGAGHAETLTTRLLLARIDGALGKEGEQELELRGILESATAGLGPAAEVTWLARTELARWLQDHGSPDEAIELHRAALEVTEGLPEDPGLHRLAAKAHLGIALRRAGEDPEAEVMLRESLAGYRERYGRMHGIALTIAAELGLILRDRGDLEGAEALLREALGGYLEEAAHQQPAALAARCDLASVLKLQNRMPEAGEQYDAALAGYRHMQGPLGRDTVLVEGLLGLLRLDQGRLEDAEPMLLHVLEVRRSRHEAGDPAVLIAKNNLGRLRQEQGRHEEAMELFGEVESGFRTREDPRASIALHNGGVSRSRIGQHQSAEASLRRANAELRRAFGDGSPWVLRSLMSLREALEAAGRAGEAREVLEAFLSTSELPAGHATLVEVQRALDTDNVPHTR
jgi:tetratricopeptide (TPR) repeat protein